MSDDPTTEITPAFGEDEPELDLHGEVPDDDDWPIHGPARGIRLAIPAAGLIAILLVGAGFWGGAALQKGHGSSGGSGGGTAALVSRLRALAGATGARGASGARGTTAAGGAGLAAGFGGAAAGTIGTISVVDGNILYVLTSTGALVKVTLDPSTATITRDASTNAAGLRPGDTVVVQGTTSSNGDVAATSVAATAPGVTSSRFGGGGGGGFFSRGSGSGGSSTSTTETTG